MPIRQIMMKHQSAPSRFLMICGALLLVILATGCASYPLHKAIEKGDIAAAQKLIAKRKGVNAFHKGYTPLHRASYKNQKQIVGALIAAGADVDARDASISSTPLYQAAGSEFGDSRVHAQIAELLLKNGAEINARTTNGTTPLGIASQVGNCEVVKALLNNGADMNSRTGNGATPLFLASFQGHADIAKLLIEHGAEVNAATNDGRTPLYIASKGAHPELVELLLSNDAAPNRRTKSGATPLSIASSSGDDDIVRLLVAHGADVNAQAAGGDTPLILALQGGHEKVVEVLVENGANIDAKGANGETALHHAAYNGYLDIVECLVTKGADVNANSESLGTPLFAAAHGGKEDVAYYLITKGAKIDETKLPQSDIEDTLAMGLCQKVCGDCLMDDRDKQGAIEHYRTAVSHLEKVSEHFKRLEKKYRDKVIVKTVVGIAVDVGVAVLKAKEAHYQARQARSYARQMAQIRMLRNSNSVDQYYSNYAAYTRGLSKRPILIRSSDNNRKSSLVSALLDTEDDQQLANYYKSRFNGANDLLMGCLDMLGRLALWPAGFAAQEQS